jgi:hypothetical protein
MSIFRKILFPVELIGHPTASFIFNASTGAVAGLATFTASTGVTAATGLA